MSTFRQQLRQEAEQWWQEGLIGADLYEKLSERYQFSEIEPEASNRFVAILLGLGGILLGLGLITFVAANWQVWPRSFRVVLLLGLFFGINAAGFYLWRRPVHQKGLQRLGHGLLLTGALALGATMALMSQMFHQSGQPYELYFVWGLGVALMAYSLRLTSLGVLSWALVSFSYASWWFSGLFWSNVSWLSSVVEALPLIVCGLFVPLAYRCGSRVLFVMAGLTFAATFSASLLRMTEAMPGLLAIALLLPPALLWAYDRDIWRYSPRSAAAAVDPFQPPARSLAVWLLSAVLYVFSFGMMWPTGGFYGEVSAAGSSWWFVNVLVFGVLTGLGWLRLRHQLRGWSPWQEKSVNTGAIALILVLAAGLFLFQTYSASDSAIVAAFLFNVMLFLLAIALLRDGLALGIRRTFWGGMGLLVLGLMSRLFEYNTALVLKAAVLALCGVGIIVAGLWFERHLKPAKQPARSSQ